MKQLLLGLFFSASCIILYAQDQTTGDFYSKQADEAKDSSKFAEAEDFLLKAEAAWRNNNEWPNVNTTFYKLAQISSQQGQYKRSRDYSHKGLSVIKQHLGQQDTLIAAHYINIATALNQLDLNKEALDTLKLAQKLQLAYPEVHIKQSTLQGVLGDVLFDLGKPKEAEAAFIKALELLKQLGKDETLNASSIHNNLSLLYNNLYKLDKEKVHCLRSLEIKKKILPPDHYSLGVAYNTMGNFYIRRKQFRQAQTYLEDALRIILKNSGPNHPGVATCYYNLGFGAFRMGDNHKAESYFQKSLDIFSSLDNPNVFYCYMALGQAMDKIRRPKKAIEYFQTALDYQIAKTGRMNSKVGLLYSNICGPYIQLERYEEAEKSFLTSIEIFQEVFGENHPEVANSYFHLSTIFIKTKDKAKAKFYAEKCMETALLSPEAKEMLAAAHYLMARSREDGDIENALIDIQNSLIHTSDDFKSTDIFDNPKVENITKENTNSGIIVWKGKYLFRKYKQSGDTTYLSKALESFVLSEDFLRKLREEFTIDDSKIDLGRYLYPAYEGQIDCYYELYQLTNNPSYLEKAFAVSSFTKSIHLRELVKASSVNSFAGIPDSVILKREDLINQINLYKENVFQSQLSKNTTQLADYKEKLFRVNKDYENFNKLLASKYTAYFNMLYNWAPPSIEEIRTQLTNQKTALVEFFTGEDATYVFLLTNSDLRIERVTEEIKDLVLDFRKSVTDFDFISESPDEANSLLINKGHILYELLLKKSFTSLSANVDRIVIIPDGILGHLPFGLLQESVSESDVSYARLPYLLKKYTISYGFSSALLLESSPKSNPSKTFAGFSPSYPNKIDPEDLIVSRLSRDGEFLLDLPNAAREVSTISSILNGDHWLGEDASESVFKKQAPNYSILHLSMHGILNDEDPTFSKLIFTNVPDSLEDNQLHVVELYGMKLNASMAVISACNSGLGKISKGEGIMSLSRAFAYAGVPATIMSLWSVPDESTADLMISFYEKINQNQTKDQALRDAKLAYLEAIQDPAFSHPYFWGGFVPIGDMSAIPTNNGGWMPYGMVFGLMILLIVVFVMRKRRL